jgi:peptidoglycan/LPS O-acetylase OafA/YrhL
VAIELFRGIAALMVMVYHYAISFFPGTPLGIAYLRTGVDLFFVISGYVFGPMLLRDFGAQQNGSHYALLPFWLRRFFRIYPLYLLALVAYFLFAAPGELRTHYFLRHLAFLQTTESLQEASYFNDAFWTLPVEMEFYLALPLLALLRKRPLLLVALSAASLMLAFYATSHLSGTINFWFILSVHLPSILPEFMLGALLAAMVAHGRAQGWRWYAPPALWALGSGVVLLLGAYYLRFGPGGSGYGLMVHSPWNFLCASGYVLLMFPVLLCDEIRWPLWLRQVALLAGASSYGVYLFHNVVRLVLTQAEFSDSPALLIPLAMILTVALSLLLYHFYEGPLRRLGRKLARWAERGEVGPP